MASVHEVGLVGLRRLLAAGEVSALEVADQFLARIAERDGALHAFRTVSAEAARSRASALDERRRREPGPAADLRRFPLWGLPYAEKDLMDRAGAVSYAGSRVRLGAAPAGRTDPLLGALDAGGAVSLGRTDVPEFGLACYGRNLLPGGGARHPRDSRLDPGGSSSGAAVAVAAGMLPAALASDGGGSARIPAAACGLVAVKPSRGLLHRRDPGPGDLLVAGPLARTVADAALFLDALVGPGRSDRSYLGALEEATGAMRIGWHTSTPWAEPYEIDIAPEAYAALDTALARLRGMGHQVVHADPPTEPGYAAHFRTVWQALLRQVDLTEEELDAVEPLTAWLARAGARLTPERIAEAQTWLAGYGARLRAHHAAYDVMVTPALAMTPRRRDWYEHADPEENFAQQSCYTPFTSPINVAGLPAVVVPTGTYGGCSMGVQLIGRVGGEALLLRLASDLEAAHTAS